MPQEPTTPPSSPAGATPAQWQRDGTLYVVGIDGMTLDVIEALGPDQLPRFAQLAAEGCHGRLKTIWPTNSSLLWATIATGRHHDDHGIDDFWYYRLGKRRLSYTGVRKGPRWRKQFIRLLSRIGLAPLRFFDSRDLRTKTFWDIVADAGGRVGVVNWWHTWPARPTDGFVVSDRLMYWHDALDGCQEASRNRLVFPEELLATARELTVAPCDVALEEMRPYVNLPEDELAEFATSDFRMNELRGELRFLISADRSCAQILEGCLDRTPGVQLAALYLRGPDIAQHCAFQYAPWAHESGASDEDRRRFGGAVAAAYRLADELLGRVLDRMGPEDSLLVLSDHGFAYMDERRGYGHRYGEPPGVFYAYGKEFQPGVLVRDASIYDLTPTVLRLGGLPPGRNMVGRPLEQMLTPEFRRDHPPRDPIDGYGARGSADDRVALPRQVTKDIEEHLRGLGYLE